MAGFEWPWQYNFPPFFTVQLNSDTREKQLEAWCDLVLAYLRSKRSYVLDIGEAHRLSLEGINLVLNTLETRGNVEWQGKDRARCLVMWRSPQEWGKMVHQWAQNSGLGNSVCTLYELHSGDDASEEEFCGMEVWMLTRVIKALEREGKAELIPGASPDGSDAGVKFF